MATDERDTPASGGALALLHGWLLRSLHGRPLRHPLPRPLGKPLGGRRQETPAGHAHAPKFEPEYTQVPARRSAARQEKGNVRHSGSECNAAIGLDPRNATYYRMRGHLRNTEADLDGALADFNAAIALDPAFVAAYADRGSARFLKFDVAGALADYDMALRLDPRRPNLHRMRALARRAAGDLAGAHADLCAALHVDGDTADIYNDRGRVSMECGDYAAACADYEAAGRLRPRWSQPRSNRGWALVLVGELDEALCAFAEALALEPGDALALYGQQAVAARHHEAACGEPDAVLINDPEMARMIAASGIAPVADLANVTSLEP